ncbi:uncharacterized protein BO87DRAFT_375076 [Aspergillus neoniger CBS 115656]|uniref:Uncharacterized protein n=1 Tax=Aspergillus neoniger (strain CBS 115656) TaxID=1448310 RepID=A0A318YQA1_ASPNB|nr:hypothetical protein BO87DRAFT_375076 [Aspergillus neoniger CBS 115656]PYH36067.1 hypothetical protein BO87DRAFT_375076 [Aspergillus neoniger CBS 115656]
MLPRNIHATGFSSGDESDCPNTLERNFPSHPPPFPLNTTIDPKFKPASGSRPSLAEQALTGNASDCLRKVDSNSGFVSHSKEDGITQTTVDDANCLPKKRHWEHHIPPVGDTDMTDAYIAQKECHEQQKLIAIDRHKVHKLRAMMWEQREEETAVRDSVRAHLGAITCCTCQSTAQLIEKDYAALRSIALYHLDLEYQLNQSEDELEELEQELARSAARLSRLFRPVDNRAPQGVRTKFGVARSSSDPRGFDTQSVPLTTSERKNDSQQQQPHLFTSQVQESISGAERAPVSQTSTRPVSPDYRFSQAWDRIEAQPCYDIADFESDLDEIVQSDPGFAGRTAHSVGIRSRSADDIYSSDDLVKDPFKLTIRERSSPYDQDDFDSTGPPFQRHKFIDNWILHQVRTSSLESARLRSHPVWETLRTQGLTDEDISQLALGSWHSKDAGAVVSSGSTIKPSKKPEQASTVIWHGTCRSFNNRKRTNSIAFGTRPPLRRMSLYDSAWRGFGPEDEGSQPADLAKGNE